MVQAILMIINAGFRRASGRVALGLWLVAVTLKFATSPSGASDTLLTLLTAGCLIGGSVAVLYVAFRDPDQWVPAGAGIAGAMIQLVIGTTTYVNPAFGEASIGLGVLIAVGVVLYATGMSTARLEGRSSPRWSSSADGKS